MRYILIFVCLFFLIEKIDAQVPGYMGKKMLVGIQYDYSPAFGSLIFGNFGDETTLMDLLLPSPKLGLGLKFVISDYKTFDLGYMNQTFNPARGGVGDYFQTADQISSTAHTFSFGLSRHAYHLAPIGLYLSQNFNVVSISSQYKMKGSNITRTVPSVLDFGYTIGIGSRRIFADKIAVDLAVNFNFYLIGFAQAVGFVDNSNSGISKEISNRSLGYNYFDNVVSLKLGAGYLF